MPLVQYSRSALDSLRASFEGGADFSFESIRNQQIRERSHHGHVRPIEKGACDVTVIRLPSTRAGEPEVLKPYARRSRFVGDTN